MIVAGINSPPASSCGRLFDAVAAALGLCRDRQAYEGEAAMRLEAIVDRGALRKNAGYRFSLIGVSSIPKHPVAGLDPATDDFWAAGHRDADARVQPGQAAWGCRYLVDARPIWAALLSDLAYRVPPGTIAAKFHLGLAEAVAEMAGRLARNAGFGTVALSGGCFQNAVLLEEARRRLHARDFAVLSHCEVPANDGGLALGQAAVAAARLIEAKEPTGAGLCA
jgi:hydrogenase maturation protein HypF